MLKALNVSKGAQPCGRLLLLPASQPPKSSRVCVLTPVSSQPDSERAPFVVGENYLSPEQLIAQYGQGLGSGPLTAIAARLSSMSGYGKNQEAYVYGKCMRLI